MRLHYLQHVPYETPGTIVEWAVERGFTVTHTAPGAGEEFPRADEIDWLVIMGGPMNVYEDEAHPWLPAEKRLIDDAIGAGKVVLGVCLGAQLLADVLGARVTRNPVPEIGWFPVTLTAAGREHPVFGKLPEEFVAVQWHGDTFELPDDAVHAAESQACANQAFSWGERVFGVQFHLELRREDLRALVEAAGDELVEGPWIQSAEQLLADDAPFAVARRLQWLLLDAIAKATQA